MYVKSVGNINRVVKTAKLEGVTGSDFERNRLASYLNKRLLVINNAHIQKRVQAGGNPHITAKEFKNSLEKAAEGVLFFLNKSKNDIYEGAVSHEQQEGRINSIYGHLIELPFVKRGSSYVLHEKKLSTATHELRHFFDAITQTKILALENKISRIKNRYAHWDFYEKVIYFDHSSEKDKELIIPKLKNQIEMHFNKHKTSLTDRAITLKYWRSDMKTELNAYRDDAFCEVHQKSVRFKKSIIDGEEIQTGIDGTDIVFNSKDYLTKREKLIGLLKYTKASYDYQEKDLVKDSYMIEEKITLLEQMAFETISKIKKRHQSFIEKQK